MRGRFSKKPSRLLDRHRQHLGDVLPFVPDLQCLTVVAPALADLAWDINVGQKMHLDLDDPIAAASLTTSAAHVETEAARPVSPGLGLYCLREDLAYQVENSRISRGVGPRGTSDRRLVDVDNLVQMFETRDRLVLSGPGMGAVEGPGQDGVDDLVDERALARAGYAGHADEEPERNTDVDPLQVVLRRAKHLQILTVWRRRQAGTGMELRSAR